MFLFFFPTGFKKAKNELFPKVGPGSAVAVSSFNQTRESTIFYVFGGNSYGVLQSTLHVSGLVRLRELSDVLSFDSPLGIDIFYHGNC